MERSHGAVVKNSLDKAGDPRVRKIPLSRKWQPAPVFLPGKFHGQRRLGRYSPHGRKEVDTIEHTLSPVYDQVQ